MRDLSEVKRTGGPFRATSIKVIETYVLAMDGQQMIVTAKMDTPDGGRGRDRPRPELRRVYDRVLGEERPVTH